jgi:hypothetical protein
VACGWREPRTRAQRLPTDGLPTAVTPTVQAWLATMRQPARTAAVGLVVAFSVMAPLAVVTLIGVGAMAGRQVALGVAPGESHDGAPMQGSARGGPVGAELLPVVAQAPTSPGQPDQAPHGLTLRRGCQWGQPGRNPYRGTMAQALQAAQLPAEVVAAIVSQQQAGQKAGRVSISREAIRHTTDGREFDPGAVALTFGRTLCLDTRVNFAPGHQELADYYEARDDQGRLHSVMVPDVCGNVSVLGARGERGVVAGMAAVLAQRSEALAHLADRLADPEGHSTDGATPDGGAGAAGTPAPTRGPGSLVLTALGRITERVVPRAVAAAGVSALAEVLARRSNQVAGLAKVLGDKGSSPSGSTDSTQQTPMEVPEPGTLVVVLLGLAALVVQRWRRRLQLQLRG